MNNTSETNIGYKLSRFEKIFLGLGTTMVVVSVLIWLKSAVLIPAFTMPEWNITSPGLNLTVFIIGLYLVYRGLKKLSQTSVARLDNTLDRFITYRVFRWVILGILTIVFGLITFIASSIAGGYSSNNRDDSITSDKPKEGADGLWDVSSDHYYDKEPPPPFT